MTPTSPIVILHPAGEEAKALKESIGRKLPKTNTVWCRNVETLLALLTTGLSGCVICRGADESAVVLVELIRRKYPGAGVVVMGGGDSVQDLLAVGADGVLAESDVALLGAMMEWAIGRRGGPQTAREST